jgi:hypothetical protein
MPWWYCLQFYTNVPYEVGDKFKCWWNVRTGDGPTEINGDLDDSENYSYPKKDSTFIEVLFEELPFYNEPDYMTLMVLCLGILVGLPV